MELQNQTRYPARLFRTVIDDDRIAAAVIVRITYDVIDEVLTESARQPWIVSGAPWLGPAGSMESDDVFYRDGVDVFLFGHATSPNLEQVRRMNLSLQCNGFKRQLVIHGDRRWHRHADRLVATLPEMFTKIPLAMEYAYGGTSYYDGLAIPYPDNPAGRGFYLSAELAAEQLLPNIEEPDQLIQSWEARPVPAGCGCCPLHFGPRLAAGFEVAPDGGLKKIKPRLFNSAFPKMIASHADIKAGADFVIEGVSSVRPFRFRLPGSAPKVHLKIGDTDWLRSLTFDQVGIRADENQVFITYRFPFRYSVVPHQSRSCVLLDKEV